jgi:hypothetical protein
MQAPNTIEGHLTELIAANIRKKFPEMKPHQYNPMWSAILETLEEHMPRILKMGKPMSREEFLKLTSSHGE